MKKLLVHNTSGKLEAALASRLPSGWQTRAMAAHDPWSIDPNADAVFLTHSVAGAGRRATVAMPDGWPRRVALVQLASAGLQGYPSWLFAAPIVASGRGTSALPIAEYVLTAMLAHEKRIEQLWLEGEDGWHTNVAMRRVGMLHGKNVGLLGFGGIGRQVASLARAFGMKVIATRKDHAAPPPAGVTLAALNTMLRQADHLVLAAPLTPITTGIIGRAAFAAMKPGIHLINVARGGLVDQEALLQALDEGRVAGATLDVTDPEPLPHGHPLYSDLRVRISPHIAWNATGNEARIISVLCDNLSRLENEEAACNRVTLADWQLENEIAARR